MHAQHNRADLSLRAHGKPRPTNNRSESVRLTATVTPFNALYFADAHAALRRFYIYHNTGHVFLSKAPAHRYKTEAIIYGNGFINYKIFQ